jgi:hypothetical protein
MSSTAFSVNELTEELALQVAEAFVLCDRDPTRMARKLGVDRFDLNIVMHPMVRSYIVKMERMTVVSCTLEDHMKQLAKIRDAAMDDENYKVALAAETQRGKAAGHYDPKKLDDPADDGKPIDATKLSSEELRRRLAKFIGASITDPNALPPPEPGSLEGQAALDDDDQI